MDARAALDQWLEHLAQERRLSPRTLAAYGFIGRRYLGFLERHRGGPLSAADLGEVGRGAELEDVGDAPYAEAHGKHADEELRHPTLGGFAHGIHHVGTSL